MNPQEDDQSREALNPQRQSSDGGDGEEIGATSSARVRTLPSYWGWEKVELEDDDEDDSDDGSQSLKLVSLDSIDAPAFTEDRPPARKSKIELPRSNTVAFTSCDDWTQVKRRSVLNPVTAMPAFPKRCSFNDDPPPVKEEPPPPTVEDEPQEPDEAPAAEDAPLTLRESLELVMPASGSHSQKVLTGVTAILSMYEQLGKPMPTYFWIPFKKVEAQRSIDDPDIHEVLAFDEAGMVPEKPEDATGYPGWILLEARTNAVWNGRLWNYSLKAAAELANLQAGLLFCCDLQFTAQYAHVNVIVKDTFIFAFTFAQVLGLCVAWRRVNFAFGAHFVPAEHASFWDKWDLFQEFLVEVLLDFVSLPSELRDAPQDFGPVKNHGMVGGYNQAAKVPLIALGVEAQYQFEKDRAFLSRIPRVILHDGLCFVVLLHLGSQTVIKHGLKALTFSWLFAVCLSIVQFFEESSRGIEWITNFRRCSVYRQARASDPFQKKVVQKAAAAKIEEMKNQCPIL
jgi:hypothetical protein